MDPMTTWFWFWLIVAAGLLIGEMLTVTFFLLPFAVGAIAALVANLIGLSLTVQWFVFLILSIIALAAFRPLAKRLTRGDSAKVGVDRLSGLDAVIIDQPAPEGLRRAKVSGETWNVALEQGFEWMTNDLQVGEHVYVLHVEGTRLIVRRY